MYTTMYYHVYDSVLWALHMETGGILLANNAKTMLLNAIRNTNGLSFRKNPKDLIQAKFTHSYVHMPNAYVTYVGIHVNTGNFMGGTWNYMVGGVNRSIRIDSHSEEALVKQTSGKKRVSLPKLVIKQR